MGFQMRHLSKKLVGIFLSHVFTLKQFIKQKNIDFQSIKKKLAHSIKIPKISMHLRLTIYLSDHLMVKKHGLKVE
jgi:hypothetical protein